jgi:hypothetical protein
MTKRAPDVTARARADGDPEELVAWCATTSDVMAFREALRRISPERWPGVYAGVAEALGAVEPRGAAPTGYAADRARRGRSAARVLKLQMLDQEVRYRSARDPAARAPLRLSRSNA